MKSRLKPYTDLDKQQKKARLSLLYGKGLMTFQEYHIALLPLFEKT